MKKLFDPAGIIIIIILIACMFVLIIVSLKTNNDLKLGLVGIATRPTTTVPAPKPTTTIYENNLVVNQENFGINKTSQRRINRTVISPGYTKPSIPNSLPVRVTNYVQKNNFNFSNYSPKMEGDYGTTFTREYHPLYWIRASNQYTVIPKWNGEYPMTLSDGYWLYEDRAVTLDDGGLKKDWAWCVWVGKKTSGASTYDMYLPHEVIKPLLREYLGREYGEISSDDLKILSQYSSGIKDGTIRPNRIIDNTATGIGKDFHLYEGWEFFTKIQYVCH